MTQDLQQGTDNGAQTPPPAALTKSNSAKRPPVGDDWDRDHAGDREAPQYDSFMRIIRR